MHHDDHDHDAALWAELQACPPGLPHGRQAAREAIVAGVAAAAVLGVIAVLARVVSP